MNNAVISRLKELHKKQQFHPGLLGAFTNPFFLPRKALAEAVLEVKLQIKGRVLDVGCGTMPYKNDFSYDEYVGLEIDTLENRAAKNADYFYDGITFPFADASFDSVICNEVLEHVFSPSQFVLEIRRVLKPGGRLLLTVPFIWDEHEQPYDYGRYSSYGLTHLLESSGLKVLYLQKTCTGLTGLCALLNSYLFKKTLTGNHYLNLVSVVLFMSVFNMLGMLFARFGADNKDLYLDNVVICQPTELGNQ